MGRKRKRKRSSTGRSKRATGPAVLRLDSDFSEMRYEPKTSQRQLLAVLLMSLGALGLGAGIYGQYLWNEPEPWKYAPYLIAAGVAMLIGYLVVGKSSLQPIVVGELGIGVEQDGRIARHAWYELQRITLDHGILQLRTAGKPVSVPLAAHTPAARRIVREALRRIPKRVELEDDEVDSLGRPERGDGSKQIAEPPQVTELSCRASDRPLTFEKDVRMCALCGALYHRAGVPSRCVECQKKLKR